MRKFNVGDPARFTDRTPDAIKDKYQSRTRRVSSIFYNSETQSTRYYIGDINYPFRSYMLKSIKKRKLRQIGRPKSKRAYRRT